LQQSQTTNNQRISPGGIKIPSTDGWLMIIFMTKNTMRYLGIIFCSLTLALACKQKVLSGAELENKLIKTMQGYLDKEANTGVTYSVKDVNYYADKIKKQYNCEFHVHVHANKDNFDTTGIMKANIPNDFSKVERLQ
jgi:hypothetical protein